MTGNDVRGGRLGKIHRSLKRPRVTSLLRAAVLAAAAIILSWPLTVTTGVVAAALGALSGALVGDRLGAKKDLRLGSTLLLALLALGLGIWLARFVVRSALIAGLLSPIVALHFSEALLWLSLTGAVALGLRFLAARRPLWAVGEALAVALAVAASFSAHRDGMVHRPLVIGDWAWSQGIDPVLVFLAFGGITAFVLAALLMSEERRRRIPLHLSALVVIAIALLLLIRVDGLPKPQGAGDLGLTGDPDSGQPEDGEDGEGAQANQNRDDQLGDIEFQDEYGSSGDQAPVAVVVFHDDYSPPSGVYYFRQTVFSQFNGRRLVQATRDDVDLDIVDQFPMRLVELAAAPVSDRRMALETSMGLVVDHIRPFALDAPATMTPVRNPNPLHFQRAFKVRSHVQTLPYQEMIGQRPGHPKWKAEQWEHYTEAPSDPRYSETATALMDRLRPEYKNDPLAQSLAIKNYLDENGTYSRKSTHADTADPAASFLFGDLTGYCVHFAHAATYLFRSLDIPARVAAGYAVEEGARAGGSAVMIRSGDAHAWPEIYLEGVGWVVVDLAPENTLEEPMQAPDRGLQRMLGEMMRQQDEEMILDDELQQQLSLAAIVRFLLRLLMALLVVAYAIKVYRWLAPRYVRSQQLYRVAYRSAMDRLAEIGLRRRFGESRESFAHRTHAISPSFTGLTEEHLKTALGSRQRAEGPLLKRLTTNVSHEIRQRVPKWKRWLGVANPVSWMLVR